MDAVNLWCNEYTLSQGNEESSCRVVVMFLRTAMSLFVIGITHFLGRALLEFCPQLHSCEKASAPRTRFTALPSVCAQTDGGFNMG